MPVINDVDVVVLGGSCTGVFAAIRAARLGCRVAVVERAGCFGGVATISLVNCWHSPLDTVHQKQIIAGLTTEIIERLRRRNLVSDVYNSPAFRWRFNSCEMQIELDEMVREAGVMPYLHTSFVAPYVEDGRLTAVIIEDKSGRRAIRARVFIDATGDADLCDRLGLETYIANATQPSTTCAVYDGWNSMEGFDLGRALAEHGAEFDLPQGFVWGSPIPPSTNVFMVAGTRVTGANCSDAVSLTHSEIEGRRQVRATMDLIRKYHPQNTLSLQGLAWRIGIRESRHVRCRYQITGEDVLNGVRFDDAVVNGSYRVDIHHQDRPGITTRYLDGTQRYEVPGRKTQVTRWRPPLDVDPTFYQVPLRCLIPRGTYDNLLVAGRLIDADSQAHAAVRVMVNTNQMGEAAGVAAYLALHRGAAVPSACADEVRRTLADGGSIVL